MAKLRCGDRVFVGVQAVVFDKDGTLADSDTFLRRLGQTRSRLLDAQIPGVQEPLLMAFGLEGDCLNPAGLLAVGTRQENAIAAAAYVAETGRDWFESLQIVQSAFEEADRYFQDKAAATPLFEGTIDMLQGLNAGGVKLGILSADTTENVADFVRHYQLGAYFQLAMGAGGELSKPDPQFFLQACQALDVDPGETLMVGDTRLDLEMALAAGASGAVAVCHKLPLPSSLKKVDVAIGHFSEVQVL